MQVVAINHAALTAGAAPGLTLAEARARVPALAVASADPAADRRALDALAAWCERYTPWTAVDADGGAASELGAAAGLWLNVTGCTHLFGGEAALLGTLVARLAGFGLTARAALADTPGAAWAVARAAAEPVSVIAPGATAAALAPLPVAALRLAPATLDALHRLGLRRIGQLAAVPRGPLLARFGRSLLDRLDQALGRIDEPITPRRPVPALRSRLTFAEPIGRAEDVLAVSERLLADLCGRLALARQGARRVELALYRTDGSIAAATLGTARPVHDPDHLGRLLRGKLEGLDAGPGIEAAILAAAIVEPLTPRQTTLLSPREPASEGLARLIDRLANRLGADNVLRLAARPSHIPERASLAVPAAADPLPAAPAGGERSRQPRPLLLLSVPQPIEVIAPVPDGPPVSFRRGWHRHQVIAAEGPERIAPEWWRRPRGHAPEQLTRVRDYYRIEDGDGRRFWVYRDGFYRPGIPPRWYLHGLFP